MAGPLSTIRRYDPEDYSDAEFLPDGSLLVYPPEDATEDVDEDEG